MYAQHTSKPDIGQKFITLLGGAVAWPLAARGQQGDRLRRIGVLMGPDENDPEGKRRYSAFTQALADLGWTDGRNVRIDLRYAGADRAILSTPPAEGLVPKGPRGSRFPQGGS